MSNLIIVIIIAAILFVAWRLKVHLDRPALWEDIEKAEKELMELTEACNKAFAAERFDDLELLERAWEQTKLRCERLRKKLTKP